MTTPLLCALRPTTRKNMRGRRRSTASTNAENIVCERNTRKQSANNQEDENESKSADLSETQNANNLQTIFLRHLSRRLFCTMKTGSTLYEQAASASSEGRRRCSRVLENKEKTMSNA